MQTQILNPDLQEDIQKAGEILRNGGLVAIPTETVYGLAGNALNASCVQKIYTAKGRPSDNPLIVHVACFEDAKKYVKEIPEKAWLLAEKFCPGALTMIMPKADIIPNETSGGLNSVAIRVPSNEIARKIISEAGCPLAAPSANISGKPSPTTFAHVFEDMDGKIDAIVKSSDCSVGLESTVITLCTEPPTLLRPGAISKEEMEEIIGEIVIDKAVTNHVEDMSKVASPGMKYKHYSPNANIILSKLSFEDYVDLVNSDPSSNALCFDGEDKFINNQSICYGKKYNSENQAKKLFSALHKIDELNFQKVYARCPSQQSVGLAVYNRLIRACGFDVILPETKIIGLTGQTGAGKTCVAKEFSSKNIPIIDCDEISRNESTYYGKGLEKLVQNFGEDILLNGVLQRKELAKKAFVSPEKTKILNEITLPLIMEKVREKISDLKSKGEKIIILDAPTLFEASADNLCTHIIAVTAKEDIRLQRIMKRDSISLSEAQMRMNSQFDSDYYIERADFVVNTSENEYKQQTEEIMENLLS